MWPLSTAGRKGALKMLSDDAQALAERRFRMRQEVSALRALSSGVPKLFDTNVEEVREGEPLFIVQGGEGIAYYRGPVADIDSIEEAMWHNAKGMIAFGDPVRQRRALREPRGALRYPALPSDELLEYFPTQAFMEYLAEAHD